ncbi:MAG TPA: CvpA family protein, partial [Pyrinomonadaceae bacterium]
MNLVDLLLVLLVLSSMALGWQRGFILSMLDLVRWVGSFIVALRFYRPAAVWLTAHTSVGEVWSVPLGFLVVATVTGLAIQLVGYQLVKRLPANIHRRRLTRAAGLLPGLASGLIFAAVAAPLLMSLPLPEGLRGSTRESVVANQLAMLTERIETSLRPVFDEAINQTINMRTIRPESDERVELPFKVAET